MSSERDRLVWALGERVKELTLLHRASRLLGEACSPNEELLTALSVLIPPAWQFPELCEARIRWEELAVQTPGFRETPWMQQASFGAGAERGLVEVAYREPPPSSSEPFLAEEVELIRSFGEMLGASLGRLRAEQRLREREARLTFLQGLADATREVADVDEFLRIVVRMLGSQLQASRCAFAHVGADGVRCTVPFDYVDGVATMRGTFNLTGFGVRALRKAEGPVVIGDIEAEFPPAAAALNVARETRAMIVCSYFKEGTLRSLLNVQQSTPRQWTEHEVMLVQETAARTWAKIEQRAAEAKLGQNEALIRIAGQTARLGGWSLDLTSHRVSWSDEVCAIHEVPKGTSPTSEQALAFFVPEARPAIAAAKAACIRDGTPYDLEVELTTAIGRRVWVRAIGRAERNLAGEITRVHGALQDVSERRRLEDHLRQAQKMEAIGQLAAGVAHDFNNFLSVILSYAALVIDDLPEGHQTRADVEQIHAAGSRAADLTRQLLTFSRQQVIKPRLLDLKVVIAGIDKMLRRVLGEDVQLSVVADEGLGRVLVDLGQLEQVLMNLVVNARDAMQGRGSVTIELSNVTLEGAEARQLGIEPGPVVRLAISDTGQGMDAATCARIFEPFYTTKDVGSGTGLGLATVHGVVSQSGGHVSVESKVGVGTTFVILLPRKDESGVMEVGTSPRPITLRGTETILVVEDSEAVRASIRSTLRRAGYDVLEAQNAGEALLVSEQFASKIHLLLTDVVMPRLGGRELADRLVKSRPETRVLFTSGYSEETFAESGPLEPGRGFLPKPITPDALLAKTREMLDADLDATAPAIESEDVGLLTTVHGEHVLHVDDEEALVQLTARVLKRLGYRVTGFTDPVAAVRAFQAQPDEYQAVVTDVTMHTMSGFEVVREVRRTRPSIPVVVTSGSFRQEDIRAAHALGLRALVVKPDTVEALGRALHRQLRAHTARTRA